MSRFVPIEEQYKKTLADVSHDLRTTIIIRLMSETGMAREELVNLKRSDFNRYHPRGLWIEKAKKIKKGRKEVYEMRSREVPINSGLFTLLNAYLDTHTSPLIIDRLRAAKGSFVIPLEPQAINKIFTKYDVKWSPHDCRHYFKSQVQSWMRKNRCIDFPVIKEIMGHVLDVSEKYGGGGDFEYKLKIVDSVFG